MSENHTGQLTQGPNQLRNLKLTASVAAATLLMSACTESPRPSDSAPTDEKSTEATSLIGTELPTVRSKSTEVHAGEILLHTFDADPTAKEKYKTEGLSLLTLESREGKWVVDTVAPGVTVDDLLPISQAVSENKDWLDAAVNGENLSEIRFTFQPKSVDSYRKDGAAHYSPAITDSEGIHQPSYAQFELPGKSISTELVSVMLRHELAHAVTARLAYENLTATEDQFKQIEIDTAKYRELCGSIRQIATDQALRSDTQYGSEVIAGLNVLAQNVPDWSNAVYTLLDSIDDGNPSRMQPQTGERKDPFFQAKLQECQVDGPQRLMMTEVYATDSLGSDSNIEKATLLPARVSTPLTEGWNRAMRAKGSVYEPITESTYLGNLAKDADEGHPYDNSLEMAASILNIATRYPRELSDRLKAMPKEHSKPLYELLILVSDDAIRANSEDEAFVADVQSSVDIVLNNTEKQRLP